MNSQVCIDANIIVHFLIPGPLTASAVTLFKNWEREKTSLVAPALLAFEVTATLRRLAYLKRISSVVASEAFEEFSRIRVRLSHQKAIFPLAWKFAAQFNQPRAYDTSYLALAFLKRCDLWTADERFYNAVSREYDWVRWIGEASTNI